MKSMKKQGKKPYDVLIVGAGIAGLHCALQLKKANPYWRIAIAELYSYIGGRVVTYHKKDTPAIHWENGAGRVHATHHLVTSYVKRYGLTQIPLDGKNQYRASPSFTPEPDRWPGLSKFIVSLLGRLPKELLRTHTIRQLLYRVMPPQRAMNILNRFPYRSETEVLRADVALHSLSTEMGTYDSYYVVKEGLSALIDGMVKELNSSPTPVHWFMKHQLLEVDSCSALFRVSGEGKTETTETTIQADRIVCALHADALRSIRPFRDWDMLTHLKMTPLKRIYAIFPVQKDGTSWFSSIPKTITNSPIRYFIPIQPANGIAMISYTDNKDTTLLTSQAQVMHELRKLFPGVQIPDPLFYKEHPWSEGCTYWKPLSSKEPAIDAFTLSRKSLRPFPEKFPHLFVCGESFSTRQAWIEGALEHANLLLHTYRSALNFFP